MLETIWESRWLPDFWGYSSVGRAPALQAGGRGFESLCLHGGKKESERGGIQEIGDGSDERKQTEMSQICTLKTEY